MKLFKRNKKEKIHVQASDIKDGDSLVAVGINRDTVDVEIDTQELRTAKWVKPSEELPTQPGYYFVLTDNYLAKGMAWYGESFDDERYKEGEYEFTVMYAEFGNSDKEPSVEYWLKDNHWGLVYQFKKGLKQI